MKERKPYQHRSAGFTMTELLVVITIIVVLASILLTVVSRVREPARQTGCLSNLRQIGTAVLLYSTDNKDKMPFLASTTPENPHGHSTIWQQDLDIYIPYPQCAQIHLRGSPEIRPGPETRLQWQGFKDRTVRGGFLRRSCGSHELRRPKTARLGFRPSPHRPVLKYPQPTNYDKKIDRHRVGACADLGHWCTSNLKPVECLRIFHGRIISVHLKDKGKFGPAPVVVAGKGVVDVAACLEDLKNQTFDGPISSEHENDWTDNVPQVRANIDFIKAHAK